MGGRVIGIVHNEPAPQGQAFSEASMDVMAQVEAVEKALEELGHSSVRIFFTRDLGRFIQRMKEEKVEMVFNLCETVNEDGRLSGHPAAVFEVLEIPFSGSPSMALMLTTDKFITKRLLHASAIATPNYTTYNAMEPFHPTGLTFPVMAKPRFEDASIGIDQESIFENEAQLRKRLPELSERFEALLVEEYIEGREFNASLLGYPSPSVLPVAEIDFSDFPESLRSIVGYRAKWDKTSFEYHHTPREFPQDLPQALLIAIKRTALDCFRLFMLKDYGRIDMRVDGQGRIYVLEINGNPCLSPDAGFSAAAEKAGMSYSDMVSRIVHFILQRSGKDGHQTSRASG
ncbi:MAG: D-alanine--D-alanine ligase [Deltaproteobacteria bacterium]|nr:D-alanine--D-alanine ligase [Deltaproteobacteria bacterium]